MTQRLRLLTATALTAILLPATALAQQPGVEFAVEPAPRSQTAKGGGYFLAKVLPGEELRQSILLRNESGRRLTLQLAVVDAITGQLGGVSYNLPQDAVQRTGAWIELDRTQVPLEAGGVSEVGFVITVPVDATPGEHLAGIAVWEKGGEQGRDDGAVSVNVQTRRVIAVQVDTPGPKEAHLEITGVEAAARPDGLYLEVNIGNDGTAMTTGEGTLDLPNEDFVVDFPLDTFVPATSIAYPVKWTDDPVEGEYEAHVVIDYQTGVAEWSGTLVVGDPLLAELEDRGVEVAGGLPIIPIATTVGLLMAGGLGWLLLRRRRARPSSVVEPVGPISPRYPPAPGPPASPHSAWPHRMTAPPAPPPPPPPPPRSN